MFHAPRISLGRRLRPGRSVSRRLALGMIALAAVAIIPASRAGAAGLPPQMWERIRKLEPARIELTPTASPQAPAELSLKQCMDLAVRHSAAFRQAQAALVGARQGLWVNDQRLFYGLTGSTRREHPANGETANQLSAGATARWERLGGDALALDVGTGSRTSFGDLINGQPSLGIAYDRPLLRGAGLASSTWERVRSARVQLLGESLSYYDAHQELGVQVIESYYRVLVAQGEMEIAGRAADRAKQLYDINSAKFTGEGVSVPGEKWVTQVTELDMSQARLSWEQAKQSVISRQQAFRDALDTLLLTMGLLPGATPKLTSTVQYQPQEFNQAELAKVAVANSTELAGFDLARQDALAQRHIAQSENRPDLIASVGMTDNGDTLGAGNGGSGWFAGLRVEIPLADRRREEGKGAAERALQVLEQRTTSAGDRVTQTVQRLVRAAESAKARITIGEQAVLLAQKNREQAQGMYDEGLSDYLRVFDADNRLVETERSLLQEKVGYYLTTVRLRVALGEDITQGLPE